MPKPILKEHTDIRDEIEKKVRIHYHLLPFEEEETVSAQDNAQADAAASPEDEAWIHGDFTREEQQAARRKALLLLEHMDRTEKGLSDRLRQAGFCCRGQWRMPVAYVSSFGYVG